MRLPGGGGAPEIAANCGEIFITMAMSPRAFVDKLDFITSLGHGTGPDSREKLGLKTKGPTKVATDLCVMEPDPETRELTVVSLHPGVTREAVQAQCGWKLKFADDATETPPPTAEELTVLRDLQARTASGPWRRSMSREAFICDAIRTPIGRFGGALATVRADDLAAIPIRALLARHKGLAETVEEVIFGCANQAGEDNRNVARMAALLAGLPDSVPGTTMNRLCASGLDAVGTAARAIRTGELDVVIAGGVESMTRAPLVMGKAETAFQRSARDRRHDHRLALHQSSHEGAIRRRFDAGDRARTSPTTIRSAGPTRTPSPCARRSAPGRRWKAAG